MECRWPGKGHLWPWDSALPAMGSLARPRATHPLSVATAEMRALPLGGLPGPYFWSLSRTLPVLAGLWEPAWHSAWTPRLVCTPSPRRLVWAPGRGRDGPPACLTTLHPPSPPGLPSPAPAPPAPSVTGHVAVSCGSWSPATNVTRLLAVLAVRPRSASHVPRSDTGCHDPGRCWQEGQGGTGSLRDNPAPGSSSLRPSLAPPAPFSFHPRALLGAQRTLQDRASPWRAVQFGSGPPGPIARNEVPGGGTWILGPAWELPGTADWLRPGPLGWLSLTATTRLGKLRTGVAWKGAGEERRYAIRRHSAPTRNPSPR